MFCKICTSNIGKFVTESPAAQPPSSSAVETENTSSSQQFHCAFCFGLLAEEADGSDQFLEELAQEADALFKSEGYDGNSFLLALNMPTSLLLRESIVERLAQGRWAPTSMSPKELFSRCLMNRLAKVTGLRPSLNSDLVLTVSLEHDQFAASDFHFLLQHFPEEFTNGGGGRNRKRSRNSRKRPRLEEPTNATEEVEESGEANLEVKDGNEGGGMASLLTKVKVRSIQARLSPQVARKFFPLLPATQRCTFSLAFERDPLFIGGRYRKFSRHLPQSPWGPDSDQRAGDSVSEKIASLMVPHFGASGSRFTASGREDVDVRMLGQGRPFVVQLLNARRTAAHLDQKSAEQTLSLLAAQINASSGGDIAIGSLARVSTKQALVLNVGQEEKRKTYCALCYSKVPLDEQMLRRLDAAEPVEIVQKTAIRVLKRRPLLERRRTIFWMRALQLDQFHFQLRLQTQAGTYVKEFVHSDFGRTRPSLAELMHLPLGQVDILQLDVLAVHLEWPPTSSSTVAAPTSAAHNKSNQSSNNRR